MDNHNKAPNYRRRRIVAAAAIVGGLAGGAAFGNQAIGENDAKDSIPPVTGTYMVDAGENATVIAREFTDSDENFVQVKDQVQSQADASGNIMAGQLVQINVENVDDPNAPEFEPELPIGPKLPK